MEKLPASHRPPAFKIVEGVPDLGQSFSTNPAQGSGEQFLTAAMVQSKGQDAKALFALADVH